MKPDTNLSSMPNTSAPANQNKKFPFEPDDIRALMPGRFILRLGVTPNRFTCRHPRNARCSCQGAPPPSPASAPPPKQKPFTTTTDNTIPAALQRIRDSYQKTLVQMLFAVRSFPEAAAAVQRILTTAPPDHQPRDTTPPTGPGA